MNRAAKEALLNFQGSPIHLRTALFHSTPVLDRRRRTYWDSGGGAYSDSSRRFNQYSKRFRKLHAKQTLLRNVSAFAENLFQDAEEFTLLVSDWFKSDHKSWEYDRDEHDPSSSQRSEWFRREFQAKGPKGGRTGNKGSQPRYKRFCEDEVEVETIFRTAFSGNGHFYWSFVDDEFPQWRSSSDHSSNYRTSWKWRHEEDYDSSTETNCSETNLASDRMALGLRAYGPLNIEDVKNAYRSCALKWHPDRHQGSSKADAEAKFKVCSAAYRSLCDKLALN